MKYSELKSRPVVSVSGAEKLGFVDDVYLNADTQRLLGFRIRRGGLLTHHEALVLSDVSAVGDDAVTVADASKLNSEDRFADLKGSMMSSQIVGSKIMTESGQEFGTIADLGLDLSAGTIVEYFLGVGLVDRLRGNDRVVPTASIISLSAGLVVVSNAEAEPVDS